MPQIRLESTVRQHPKFIKAGPAACWLYVCAIGYCQEHLTDGRISPTTLRQLGVRSSSGQGKLTVMATKLVEVGLWEQVASGWVIHDYLKHNKSADEIRALIQTRKDNASKGGKASGESRRDPEKPKQSASPESKQLASEESKQLASEIDEKSKQVAEPDLDLVPVLDRTYVRTAPADAAATRDPVENSEPPKTRTSKELAKDPSPKGNYRVIQNIAKGLLNDRTFDDDGELIDVVKAECARLGIAYGPPNEDHDVVHRAVASARCVHAMRSK